MHLDILDIVTLEIRGESHRLRNYLRHEYSIFEADNPTSDSPEIVVEFVDDIADEENTVHVRGPVSYDDEGVFFQHRLPGEDPEFNAFRLGFDGFDDGTVQVTCDRDFNPHFFGIIVDYLIHFQLLRQGAAYCHSCGFVYNGAVVVCPAWRNVGKTNLLLSFLEEDGVSYISDDWCVVHEDGTVDALPKRLNLLYYNFDEYPSLLDQTPESFRSLVDFISRTKAGEFDLNQAAINTLTQQARMRISPYDLFDDIADDGRNQVDYLFYLRRPADADSQTLRNDVSNSSVPYRMNSILEFEQIYFHMAYQVYKAQTGNVVQYLEESRERTIDILSSFVSQTPNINELTAPGQRKSDELHAIIADTITDAK